MTAQASQLQCYDQKIPEDLGLTAYVNVKNDVNVWYYRTWTPKIGDEGLLQRTCLQLSPNGVTFLGLVKDMTHASGILHERMVTCFGVQDYDKVLDGTHPSWLKLIALRRELGYIDSQNQFVSFNLYTARFDGKWHLFSELVHLSFPAFDDHNVMPFTKVNGDIRRRGRVEGAQVRDCQVDWRFFSLSEADKREDLLKGTPFYRRRCVGETPILSASSEGMHRYKEALSGTRSLAVPSAKWKRPLELTPRLREVFSSRFTCEEVNVLRVRVQQSVAQEILSTAVRVVKQTLFGARDIVFHLLQEWQTIDPYIILRLVFATVVYGKTGSLLLSMMALVVVQGWAWILGVKV